MSAGHQELLADIATAYYVDNAPKVEIAKAHGLSRFQVARYLEEARREGIVTISIHRPARGRIDVAALAAALGVDGIEIADRPGADQTARDKVAEEAAAVLVATVRDGDTVGVSWSRTLNLMASRLARLPQCDIVQLAGDLKVGNDGGSGQLLHRLGAAAGGRTWPLPTPLIVETAETAASLRRQPEISEALARADGLDVAVVAVGTWAPQRSTVWERLEEQERTELAAHGAVAEVSGRVLDEQGRPIESPLDARVISVTLEQLRRARTTIAVGYGRDNLPGLVAALRAGFIQRLVVDDELALALAEHAGL
ncbi:sugar-binding domain-containing protein [Zhihengliuella sp.]|uniref:sugar-binding transcriptional regulator n=1 Tax=Zhihengliuella sp. TaxID=1954483 RepID=UPI002811940A|nr:sugar-binding domain-containing protein [Zhihengliuella sp.]